MAKLPNTALLCLLLTCSSVAGLTLPDQYDASTRPNQGGVADVVNVAAELLSIRSVIEENAEMIVDISLHTSWVDSRLVEVVSRDSLFVNKIPEIWTPNVVIANSAESSDPSQATGQALQLGKDGLVKHSQKFTARISCPISLAKYPFDKQICKVQLNSFGYTSIHLVLVWHGTVSDDVAAYHPEFSFSYSEQSAANVKTADGEYSNLYLEIAVARCPLRVIFRAMLPALLLLILSYYVTFCHCNLLRKKATANGNHVEATTVVVQPRETSSFPVEFKLFLIAMNGMIFLLTVFIAQINFIESPKSSAVSGLDVWLNFIIAILFVILWHSVQIYFNDHQFNVDTKNQSDACFVNRTANILKIGVPVVLAVFIVVFCGIYLS